MSIPIEGVRPQDFAPLDVRPFDGGLPAAPSATPTHPTIGPLPPESAAARVRAELDGNPAPADVQRAMDRIASPHWTPEQRDRILTDLASDGTLSRLVNAMNRPPDIYQEGYIDADAQRGFYASLAGGSGPAGLVATQQAIAQAAGTTNGEALRSSEYFAEAVAGHASDVVKADFVQQVAAADVSPSADAAGNHYMDLGSRAAATVLASIGSPAEFGAAVRGLEAAGDLPAVLRNAAGFQETLHGHNISRDARSSIDGVMDRVAALNDPALSARVLQAATTGQPEGARHVADAIAPSAARLLTDTPAADGKTGAQRVVEQLYSSPTGDQALGRLMAGLHAGEHGGTAEAVARATFANVDARDPATGEFLNARYAGFFMQSTFEGLKAYTNAVEEDRSTIIDFGTAPIPVPGGPIGGLVAEGLKTALGDGWKNRDAAAADAFVRSVGDKLNGTATAGANNPHLDADSPTGNYLLGAGSVSSQNFR